MNGSFSPRWTKSKPMGGQCPEAYRRGVQDFYGREFAVTPDVLIPRPETEQMVDAVLNLAGVAYLPGVRASAPRVERAARILEVGTGSGCVAITLALELPEAKVVAVDVSPRALAVARENARRLGAERVELVQSDLLKAVTGEFEIVVANLPYVDRKWDWLDVEALSFEPELALYAEDGGCGLIFELMRQIAKREAMGVEFVVLEADPSQHERIKKYAAELGWRHIETRGFILTFCIPRG